MVFFNIRLLFTELFNISKGHKIVNVINWCMKTFGTENMYYVDCNKGKDSWRDMYLMSECRHHINANSTFSWWAAWLSPYSNGIVLHPKYFIKDIETKDYYPQKWIMIE